MALSDRNDVTIPIVISNNGHMEDRSAPSPPSDTLLDAEKGPDVHGSIGSSVSKSTIGMQKDSPSDEQPVEYPGPVRLCLIVFTLCLAVFLCGLDQTIIATAAPRISDDFHALNDIGWWTSAYLLTTSTFQLFYGTLYSHMSIKVVYLTAIFIFEIGSLICATSPNSTALIFGRAVAGLGAAGMFNGSVLVLAQSTPLEKRAAYTGIITGMFGIASIAGPFLGGVLTDNATWRWCFGINMPIAFVTMLVVGFLGPKSTKPTLPSWPLLKKIDVPGNVLFIASFICLILALQWGGTTYAWDNGRIIALLVLSGILLIVYAVYQYFQTGPPIIPRNIFKVRSLWFAIIFAVCIASGMFVAVIYLPIYFQAIMDSSALRSGVQLTPLMLGFVVFSVICGGVTTYLGYSNPFMILSTVLSSIGAGLITTFAINTPSSQWIGYQVLYGFGVGAGLQQPFLIAQTVLAEADIPIGVSLISLSQTLGGAVFVAVAQSIWENRLTDRLAAGFPGLDVSSVLSAGATDVRGLFTPAQLPQALDAYLSALSGPFYITLALSCASVVGALGVEWKSMKKDKGKAEKQEKAPEDT